MDRPETTFMYERRATTRRSVGRAVVAK